MTNSSKRWAVSAGAIGLVGGLALGATGLASAVGPSPSPGARNAPVPGGQLPPGLHRFRGERRGAGGLVTAISGTSLTLRTPEGAKTIALNGTTAFYTGRTKATRSAVAVGDVVHVRLADPKATNPVASVIVVVPAHVAGWVTAVDGSTITLTDVDGFTRKVTTTGATKVTKAGVDSTLASVTVGSFVFALGTVDHDGTTLDAVRVGIGLPAKADRVRDGKGGGFGGPPPGVDPSADDGPPPPDAAGDEPLA